MLMLLEREMRAGSRRRITYWGRFGSAAIGTLVFWQAFRVLHDGAELFRISAFVGGGLCMLDAARRASAAIADEKADGTLGLLLLTPLSGSEVLFGKILAALVSAWPLALSITPIFAISLLLGGVSGGEVFRASLAIIHAVNIAAVAGILVSSAMRSSLGAFFSTHFFLLVLGAISAALLHVTMPINPLSPMALVPDAKYKGHPLLFWSSLAIGQAAAFGYLHLFGRSFVRNVKVEDEAHLTVAPQFVPTPLPPSKSERKEPVRDYSGHPRWFPGNPITWLTLREISMHSGAWAWTVTALFCALFGLTPVGMFYASVLATGLLLFLCVASARTFAALKQSNFLELLAISPLGAEGMIQGHRAALRKVFLRPFAILLTAAVLLNAKAVFSATGIYMLAGAAAALGAIPWIGMWMGLRSKTPARAALATIALTAIVPAILGCFSLSPIYFLLMWAMANGGVFNLLRAMQFMPARQRQWLIEAAAPGRRDTPQPAT